MPQSKRTYLCTQIISSEEKRQEVTEKQQPKNKKEHLERIFITEIKDKTGDQKKKVKEIRKSPRKWNSKRNLDNRREKV